MTSEEILRSELGAEEGSFLGHLRPGLVWDMDAFERLTGAMEEVARAYEGTPDVPRWIAEGFWFLDYFVRDWTSHPQFPRSLPDSDYERAYTRLHDLAIWLFSGESPYV